MTCGFQGLLARGGFVVGARLRGDRVAELRKAAGWLQADLAAELGTRDRRVGEWERGEQQPQPRSVAELAAVLKVNPLVLLDVDPDDPPLLALRLAAGLTLTEVADASGVPYSTYRRLEGGLLRGEPTAPVVKALAPVLQVALSKLRQAIQRSQVDHREGR